MKKSMWKHKKYGSRVYTGQYRIYGRERAFKLSWKGANKKKSNKTFESWQNAVALGWVKVS